jgi:tetratricopeptide (TPR) repeat protein
VFSVLAVAMLASGSVVVVAAERPAACRVAEALRARGYLDQALKAAQAAVAEQKTRKCGLDELSLVRSTRAKRAQRVASRLRQAGLEASAVTALEQRLNMGDAPAIQKVLGALDTTSSLVVARALIDAGFTDAGTEALRDELKKSKSSSQTDQVSDLLSKVAQRRIEVAKALESAGQHDAALEEVKAAVRADPSVNVPYELQSGDGRLPWWRSWLGEVGPWVRSIAEAAVVALVAVALVLALWKLMRRFIKRRLELGEITGDGAKDVEQGLREHFGRLKDHRGGGSLEQVTASGAAYTVPADVSKAFPSAGVIVAALDALNRLIPARRWRVAGVAGKGGPNQSPVLTLSIARRDGRVRFAETFRLTDCRWRVPVDGNPTSADWRRLSLPAAVWLTFHAGRRAPARYRRFTAVGTDQWRSYALFAAGAEVSALVDDAAQRQFARRLYLDALEVDPRNQGAALNLASVELLDAVILNDDAVKARLRDRARDRLSGLREQLQQRKSLRTRLRLPNFFHKDALWYRARYMEMSAQLMPGGSAQAAYDAGLGVAAALLDRLGKDDHWWKWGRRSRSRRDFLRGNEGSIVAALASASHAANGTPGASEGAPLKRGELLKALQTTRSGQRFDPTKLAAYAESRCLETARGRYNLACYYVRVSNLEEAKKQLRWALGLGGPGFAAQAAIDPDLAPLGDAVALIFAEEAGPAIEPASG